MSTARNSYNFMHHLFKSSTKLDKMPLIRNIRGSETVCSYVRVLRFANSNNSVFIDKQ